MKRIKAFTLAEVLITLTIIGVIAALTIPNLMQKWADHADVAKVKEAYSILSNAFKMAVAENGPLDEWSLPVLDGHANSKENPNYLAETMRKYLKVQKFCGSKLNCFQYGYGSEYLQYKTLDGILSERVDNVAGKMILANGMHIAFLNTNYQSGTGEINGYIRVDINGAKGPNQFGYDTFYFLWYRDKLIMGDNYYLTKNMCNKFNPPTGSNANLNGAACSTWIIKHGNMDYKYRNVSSEW